MRDIIIDCDPGHDDIIAIMVALAHDDELNILGFTTVAGNQTLDKVTNNLLKVETYLNIDIPVYKGYDSPIVKDLEVQPAAHGESGLDGPILPEAAAKARDLHAIEFMKKALLESDEKITFVCIGPLTNMALFLKTYPDLKDRIEEIVIMGGSIGSGNILPKAEFNIYHDPEAAKIVFASGVKLVMAGLEVCDSGSILLSETERARDGGRASRLFYDLMQFYQRYALDRGWDRTSIFDVTPVVYLLHPELFVSEEREVYIETDGRYCRGMTVVDTRNGNGDLKDPKTVLLSTDREKFIGVLFDALNKLDARYQG